MFIIRLVTKVESFCVFAKLVIFLQCKNQPIHNNQLIYQVKNYLPGMWLCVGYNVYFLFSRFF